MKMNYWDYELERLESEQRFRRNVVLIIAVVGAVIMNSFTIYGISYLFDVMKHHPEPIKQWIGIIMFASVTIAINILTVLYYASMRVMEKDDESD